MWLRQGSVQIMLNTAYDSNERPAARDAGRWVGHGDVALFLGVGDIDALHAALVARGLSVSAPHDTPHGMRQMDLTDPDGYQLCFQVRQ